MSIVKVTLPGGEIPVNGKQVSFIAPCDCTQTEAIQIEGENYTVVDALCRCVTGKGGRWAAGSIVSVVLDVDKKFAYIQNDNPPISFGTTVPDGSDMANGEIRFVPGLKNLPAGYTQLSYIESTGTQAIDSGYTLKSQNLRVVMEFALTASPSGKTLFGNQYSGTYTLLNYGSATSCSLLLGNGGSNTTTGMGALDTKHKIDMTTNNGAVTYTVNGVTKSGTYNGSMPQTVTLGVLCSSRGSNSYAENISAKLYVCQIYDNGVLVRDFVPCLNPSGVAGVYDLVSNAFFGSATGSALVAGPILENNGEAYFKTNNSVFKITDFALADAVNGGLKITNGSFTATGKTQTITVGVTPLLVICLALPAGKKCYVLKMSDGIYTTYTTNNASYYSPDTVNNDITFSNTGFTTTSSGYESGHSVRYIVFHK